MSEAKTNNPGAAVPEVPAKPDNSLPVYLFHQGTNFKSYEFMGCHKSEGGYTFRTWAPHARAVYVTGEFCNWEPRRYPRKKISDGGIWEVTIPEAGEGNLYKLVVEAGNGQLLYHADPYASYAELRPGTASRIYDDPGYKWGDDTWLERRKKADAVNQPMNIYEMHAGSWKKNEKGETMNYEELADQLIPYIKEMGYTHIELMPLSEYPFDGSWGYQVTGYFAPTSRYGTPEMFKKFVDRCHQAGIGVLMDWVPAHFPRDAHGLRHFDGAPCYEYADTRKGEHPDWGTMIFDYGRNEVISFLISSATNWVENYHIDGLRVDAVASMLYLDYGRKDGGWMPNIYGGNWNLEAIELLKKFNSYLHTAYPGVVTIAEESTAFPKVTHPVNEDGLGFDFKWNMGWMNDTIRYMQSDPFFRKGVHNNLTFSLTYAFSENFILPLSHDEVVHGKGSLINKMPGEYEQKFANLRAYITYMYAHPGKKLMFMGGEMAQFEEWGEEKVIGWDLLKFDQHRMYHDFSAALCHFYNETPALWEQDGGWEGFDWLSCDNAEQNIISFLRRDKKGNEVIVVCNFSSVTRTDYKIGVPRRGKYDEVFSSDETRFGGSGTRNGQLYTKQTPMHGRKYCLSLTIPAFSTICLYKKASAAKKPIVETKGKSAPHGEEEKKTATRRVKAAAETVAETAKKPEASAKKETKAGKAAAPAEKETVKKETKATKAKKSPAPAEKAAKEEKAKKPSSRKTKKV